MDIKKWLRDSVVIFIIAVLITLLLGVFSLKVALVQLVCCPILAAILLTIHNGRGKKPASEKAESVPEPEDQTEWRRESLIGINLIVREDSLRDDEIVDLVEEIINQILKVIEPLNSDYGGSELTFTVNSAVDRYLPNLLSKFLELGESARAGRKKDLVNSLDGLKARIDKVVSLVEDRVESEFDTEAKFLSGLMKTGSAEA